MMSSPDVVLNHLCPRIPPVDCGLYDFWPDPLKVLFKPLIDALSCLFLLSRKSFNLETVARELQELDLNIGRVLDVGL